MISKSLSSSETPIQKAQREFLQTEFMSFVSALERSVPGFDFHLVAVNRKEESGSMVVLPSPENTLLVSLHKLQNVVNGVVSAYKTPPVQPQAKIAPKAAEPVKAPEPTKTAPPEAEKK